MMRVRVGRRFKPFLAITLALMLSLSGLTALAEERGDPNERYLLEGAIERDGTLYRLRRNLTAILLMGIDQREDFDNTGLSQNGGQADFLRLIVIDNSEKKITQLAIDRDTMTPITILDVLGNESGKRTLQICLSHAYGDGGEQSCTYTVEAVSELLSGVPLDLYIALNMNGISTLNDAVGGVTVTLEDDFTELDPSMKAGTTITLMGDQAEYFVRSRMTIGEGTNEARMKRQQQYLSQLAAILVERISADENYIGTLYDELEPYLTTNIGRGRLINEAWNARSYVREETVTPVGEHAVGDNGYMQFHVDKTALDEIVLKLFYEPILK